MANTDLTHTIEKKPKNTVEITLTIPWTTIQEEYTKSFDVIAKDVTIEGFRKGKAPRAVAEKHVAKDKVYDHMIRHYVPGAYEVILKKEDLKPAYQPKISLAEAKEKEDWKILFTVPLVPDVDVKKYKDIVKKAKEEAKAPKIVTSSTEAATPEPTEEQKKEKQLQSAIDALIKGIKVEVSDVILEDEVELRLARLYDDLKRLGVTMDAYVKSRNTTTEKLREQLAGEIEETYKLEYILQSIGDEEKIQVEKEDIDKLMANLKSEEEKKAFIQNIYYYASMLRKQKILDHMMAL